MSDYGKLKNAELETILKERGLPHTGKKADMISRLQEDDAKKAAPAAAAENEDEIDWDDDTAEAPAESAPAVQAATPAAAAATKATTAAGEKPRVVPTEEKAADPSKTEDVAVKKTAEPAEKPIGETKEAEKPAAPVKDFSIGLEKSDIEKEIEARQKRAKRFGIEAGTEDSAAAEALKSLQRAKRFGEEGSAGTVDRSQVKGLDTALPDRREKRRREGGDDRGDYKRGGRNGGRNGRGPRDNRGPRDDRNGHRPSRNDRGLHRESEGGSSWMNEKDRKSAAQRAARFAAAA